MKHLWTLLINSLFIVFLFSCNNVAQKPIAMNSDIDSVSYSIGADYAGYLNDQLKKQGLDTMLVKDLFVQGFSDFVKESELRIAKEDGKRIVETFFGEMQKKQFEANLKEGEEFLAKNAQREGVTVTESGLQYEVIEEGTGEKPKADDQVTVHYHGTLINGSVFDSSVQRGKPATFGVNQVIKGWSEALQLMPAGSKWRLFIPYQLAYGERGSGRQIEPYSCLIFEVELLSIN